MLGKKLRNILIIILIGLSCFTGHKFYVNKINKINQAHQIEIQLLQNENNKKLKENKEYIKGIEEYVELLKKKDNIQDTIKNNFDLRIKSIDSKSEKPLIIKRDLKIFGKTLLNKESIQIDIKYISNIFINNIDNIKIVVNDNHDKIIITIPDNFTIETYIKSDDTFTLHKTKGFLEEFSHEELKGIKDAQYQRVKNDMKKNLENNIDGLKDDCKEKTKKKIMKLLRINNINCDNIIFK